MKRPYVFILLQTFFYIYLSPAQLVNYISYSGKENDNAAQPIITDFSQALINCLKGESSLLIRIFLTEHATYEFSQQTPDETIKIKGNCQITGPNISSNRRPSLEIKDSSLELLANASFSIINLRLLITRTRQLQTNNIISCFRDSALVIQV